MDANASGRTTKGWRGLAKKDWLAFGRRDYIAMKVLLALTVVASALYGLVGPLVDAARNAPLPVSYTTKVTSAIPLPRGATSDGEVRMEVLLGDPTLGERSVQAVPGLLGAAATIAIAMLLFQLLRSTQASEPFTKRNVGRINAIALIVGFVGTLGPLVQGFADSTIYTTGRLPKPDTLFIGTMPLAPLALMMVIALIGEAFRRGVVLRDDVEGLV